MSTLLLLLLAGADPAFLIVDVPADALVTIETQADKKGLADLEKDPTVLAATNGGIFETPTATTGLLVIAGVERHAVNTADGQGNFFLKPNGVLFRAKDQKTWRILETTAFVAEQKKKPDLAHDALQSGPLLLLAGKPHPAFNPTSTNRLLRSAACVGAKGDLHLAISNGPCTFHEISQALKAHGCIDALYLDGVISSLLHQGKLVPAENRGRDYATRLVVRTAGP